MSYIFLGNVQLFLGNVQLLLDQCPTFFGMMSNFFLGNVQLFLGNIQHFLGRCPTFFWEISNFFLRSLYHFFFNLCYSRHDWGRHDNEYYWFSYKSCKPSVYLVDDQSVSDSHFDSNDWNFYVCWYLQVYGGNEDSFNFFR